MFNFESFEFSGDLFYQKETSLPLDLTGLTLLRGRNLDVVEDEDGNRWSCSNGTGKTRLPQILEGFIFNKNPRGNFKKTVLPSFTGTLKFSDREGNKWSFTYSVKEGWTVFKNDLQVMISHKPSDVQQSLQKLLGVTRDEWSYFVYINQFSLNTLMKGKPTERRAYLENFFGIDSFYATKFDQYKAEYKKIEGDIAAMKADRLRLEDVKLALGKLPDTNYIVMKLTECDEQIAELKTKIASATSEQLVVSSHIDTWESYHKLFTQLQGINATELRDEKKSLVERKLDLEKKVKDRLSLDTFIKFKLTPHENRKPKRTEKKPDDSKPDQTEITEKEVALSQMREKLRLKKLLSPLVKQIEDAKSQITMTIEQIEQEKSALYKEKHDITEHTSLLEKGGDVCPTCKQSLGFLLDGLSVTEKLRYFKERLREIKLNEETYRKEQAKIAEYGKLVQQHAILSTEFARFPTFGVKLTAAEAEVEALKELNTKWETYNKEFDAENKWKAAYEVFISEAKALGYPEALKEDFSEDLQKVNSRIDVLDEDIKQFDKFDALTDTVIQLKPLTELEKRRDEVAAEITTLSDSVNELSEEKGVLKTQQTSIGQLKAQEHVLLKKLSGQEAAESECKILELLNDFYSPSGFKVYELKKRCLKMIERSNYWSRLFFQESYRWSMSDDLEDLDFFIQPLNSPGVDPYPVALVSSGEFNRAAKVLLFSQLEMIPPLKKTNLLFLDEIEGNLDEAGIIAFTDIVLPKLKETFKDRSIIIISHQPSIRNSGVLDHMWSAERQNRKSTLTVYPWYHRKQVA